MCAEDTKFLHFIHKWCLNLLILLNQKNVDNGDGMLVCICCIKCWEEGYRDLVCDRMKGSL